MNYKSITLICALVLMATSALQAGDSPSDENKMQPDHAPTPFSAEEIKAFCQPGHTTSYRIEISGQDPFIRTASFIEGKDEGEKAHLVSSESFLDGSARGEAKRGAMEWTQLQAHASFPEDRTEISDAQVKVPAGKYDCWKYDVEVPIPAKEDRPAATAHLTFWFAKDMPGPPVKMVQKVGDQTQVTMTLLELTRS